MEYNLKSLIENNYLSGKSPYTNKQIITAKAKAIYDNEDI